MCLKRCDTEHHHIHAITNQQSAISIMGRPPCCDKANVKKGIWTPEEDAKILAYVSNHGVGNWTQVPKKAGNSFIIVHLRYLSCCSDY